MKCVGIHMIKVCDAIMGSGKSQSAIAYMNQHPETKFVYITPYLDEARRIARACPDLLFVEPSDKLPEHQFSKLEHTRYLLQEGRNISTTHAAFRSYTQDMIDAIQTYHYVLIVDEAVDVFQELKYNNGDIQLLLDGGYIRDEGGVYYYTGKEYSGSRLRDLFFMLRCNNLIPVERQDGKEQYYYWAIPYNIISSFSEVFVLTYLFNYTEMKYFFDIFNISYEFIGIKREGSQYCFSQRTEYIPEYVTSIRSKLHVFYNPKLNQVGRNKKALSSNWMTNHPDERQLLKNNLYAFLRYHMNAKSEDIMWSTYVKDVYHLRGRGYSNQNVEFNRRATNEFRDRTVLAYSVNLFPSPQKVQFFRNHGIVYDSDGFALSTMIQWIWRSAIRDGHEIWVYIPSRRMRELLEGWMDRLAAGEPAFPAELI